MSLVSASAALPRQRMGQVRLSRWPATPALFFLVGLAVPWSIALGSFGLTLPRIVLLVTAVPCLLKWNRGDAGRRNIVDWLVLGLCAWTVISLSATEGWNVALESGGMIAVETAGAYFLARCYVRTASDFLAVVRVMFLTAIALLPFALVEALSGRNLAMEVFATVLPTVQMSYDGVRWGLKRVQSVYEHPILFGVCIGTTLVLVHLVLGYGRSMPRRWLATILVGATAFLSMSSGPFAAMGAQIALMTWARVTGKVPHNWLLLGAFVGLTFLVIEFGSNQSVPQFYISRFSFDQETAWLRLLIWEFGTASVMAHPLFGIGFGSWVRPSWMTESIDMFWIANAIRYGIPGGLLTIALPFATLGIISTAHLPDDRTRTYRLAYLIVIASFFLVGWSVHFWGATYLMLMFMLGAGGWLADGRTAEPAHARLLRGGAAITHLRGI